MRDDKDREKHHWEASVTDLTECPHFPVEFVPETISGVEMQSLLSSFFLQERPLFLSLCLFSWSQQFFSILHSIPFRPHDNEEQEKDKQFRSHSLTHTSSGVLIMILAAGEGRGMNESHHPDKLIPDLSLILKIWSDRKKEKKDCHLNERGRWDIHGLSFGRRHVLGLTNLFLTDSLICVLSLLMLWFFSFISSLYYGIERSHSTPYLFFSLFSSPLLEFACCSLISQDHLIRRFLSSLFSRDCIRS